jgi:nitrate/nitrite transport system substrate-binding protein
MSSFDDPFDPKTTLHRAGCACGHHESREQHDADMAELQRQRQLQLQTVAAGEESRYGRAVESAVMRALFPRESTRRRFLNAIGAGTALAAIEAFFPLRKAREAFAEAKGKIEKTDLKVGFIPITCATPIIMAHPMGFYKKHGLNVEVV